MVPRSPSWLTSLRAGRQGVGGGGRKGGPAGTWEPLQAERALCSVVCLKVTCDHARLHAFLHRFILPRSTHTADTLPAGEHTTFAHEQGSVP